MQFLDRERTKNGGCHVTHYLNCPVLSYVFSSTRESLARPEFKDKVFAELF